MFLCLTFAAVVKQTQCLQMGIVCWKSNTGKKSKLWTHDAANGLKLGQIAECPKVNTGPSVGLCASMHNFKYVS